MNGESGLFQIRHVPLNCSALNDFLLGSPLCVRSASVASLEVTISWSALNDGCKIVISGVKVELERREKGDNAERQRTDSEVSATSSVAPVGSSSLSVRDVDESDGAMFMANWIDVVVANFKVEVRDVTIDLIYGAQGIEQRFRVSLSGVEYFNSQPSSDPKDRSVVVAAESLRGSASVADSLRFLSSQVRVLD